MNSVQPTQKPTAPTAAPTQAKPKAATPAAPRIGADSRVQSRVVANPKPEAKDANPVLAFITSAPVVTSFLGAAGTVLVAVPGIWTAMPALGVLGLASLAVAAVYGKRWFDEAHKA
jgi:hypothetical protein